MSPLRPRTARHVAPLLIALALACVSPDGVSAGRAGAFAGQVSNYLRGNRPNAFDSTQQTEGGRLMPPSGPKRKRFWPWQKPPATAQTPVGPSAEDLKYAADVKSLGTGTEMPGVGQTAEAGDFQISSGYTGKYGAGATTPNPTLDLKNGAYGQRAYSHGTSTIDAGLVGGSQAATEFLKAHGSKGGMNPLAPGAASANEKYGVVDKKHGGLDQLTSFQKQVLAALTGPAVAKVGEENCKIDAVDTLERDLEAKRKAFEKGANTNDADRRGKFIDKLKSAQGSLSGYRECTQKIVVSGACNRMAAVEYVRSKKAEMDQLQAKFDKTPERDRDRRAGFEIKLQGKKGAYHAAVACVKKIMNFDVVAVL